MDEYVNLGAPLPKGRIGTWRMYAGASAGQSPLIHALDIGLQIQHQAVGGSGNNPMLEMRHYLSQAQRRFLESLEKAPGLRDYIQLSGNSDWATAFNRVLEAYKGFRDQHIQLTTVYIIQQAIKERAGTQSHEKPSPNPSYVGTGGTDLVQFLKQSRDETFKTQIPLP